MMAHPLESDISSIPQLSSSVITLLEDALEHAPIPDRALFIKNFNLTDQLGVGDQKALGGSSDVHMGWLKTDSATGQMRVAVKIFRMFPPTVEKVSIPKWVSHSSVY